MYGLHRDAEVRSPPAGSLRPLPAVGGEGGAVLACGRCLVFVTTSASRIEVAGAHDHRFVNPHGLLFHVGCFDRASNCTPSGPPDSHWTWFPGFTWQVLLCASCGQHLGWFFRAERRSFHGLILDRLVEREETGGGR